MSRVNSPALITPLTRDSVVTRMAKEESKNINDSITFFNNRVGGAVSLPVRFDVEELGKTAAARARVIEILKAASWRIELHPTEDERKQPGAEAPYYEVS